MPSRGALELQIPVRVLASPKKAQIGPSTAEGSPMPQARSENGVKT